MKTKTTIITLAAIASGLTVQADNTPVEPTGFLNLAVNGQILDTDIGDYFPLLNWSISKLQGQGKKSENTPDKPEVTAGDPSSDSDDAENIGLAQSNNGHGNNLDGFDCSNPAIGTSNWQRLDFYTDAGGVFIDDENK